MPMIICPRCQKRHVVQAHIDDFVCDCQDLRDVDATNVETVLELGTWEDYSGSGGNVTNLLRGEANKLQGTRAGIEGAELNDLNNQGLSIETTRQRRHLEYIELE